MVPGSNPGGPTKHANGLKTVGRICDRNEVLVEHIFIFISICMEYPREYRLEYLQKATGIDNFSSFDVLDWGGNHGNLLKDEFKPKTYTCVDVDAQGILLGKKDHPQANWLYRKKHIPVYKNTTANCISDLQSALIKDFDSNDFKESFDLIFAYSVFTHDTVEEMENELVLLRDLLRPNGIICASYIDPDIAPIYIMKREKEYGSSIPRDSFKNLEDFAYFVDGDEIKNQYNRSKSCRHFISIYNTTWLMEKLNSLLGHCDIYKPDINLVKDFYKEPIQPCFIWKKS